jgi:hypothetical protein
MAMMTWSGNARQTGMSLLTTNFIAKKGGDCTKER